MEKRTPISLYSFASIRAALLNLRVRLGSTYFAKTENFLLKTL